MATEPRRIREGDHVVVVRQCRDLGVDVGTVGRVVWVGGDKMDVVFDQLDALHADLERDSSIFERTDAYPRSGLRAELSTAKKTSPSVLKREIDEALERGASSTSGYRVAYLVPNPRRGQPGEHTMLRLWYSGDSLLTMTQALVGLRAAKRRGITAWVTDGHGLHVPVAGARRSPGPHSV